MSLELVVAIAPWLGEWATLKIAEAVLGGVNTQLKQQDLDKALKTCVAKADDQVKLFWRCEPRYIPKFLDSVFKDAVEELQKPFKNQGTPQVDYFLEVFYKSLEEHPKIKQNINESLIKPWLDIFVKNYFEVTNAYLRFKITKEAYLKQIANYFDDVKFAGIAVEGQEVDKSAQLPQIFVMPDVVEDMRERNLADEKDFVFLEANLEASGISQRQAELLREQRQIGRLEKSSGQKFSAQKLLTESTSQKFVLLGAPGSGKTTLMSYFAVMLAQKQPEILGLAADTDLLPIIIKIRDLAKRAEHLSILDYIRQFASGNLQVKELPTGFFEYWLDDGRALILLDGLDEVANEAKRYEIVNQIEVFLDQYPENRTIITSRPAGYKSAFFPTEEFPRYRLESFDDDKVEIFIKKWYESRFEDPEESQRRQESLRQALAEQKRIKELARNPLLLTIIALIHRYEAYLPRQRHKLYDRAVKTLLTNWDAGKELNYKLPCEYLHHDDVERLMQQLAYWIHTQGGTGDKEGSTLIDKEELIKQLKKFIAEEKSIKSHQAKAEAERFVAHIQERAGLLNEQGQDCYAFVHKSFQEYLAAQEIKDRQEGDGDEVVLEHIEKYLHDPHWREVLLLLIAQQHRKKTAKFLKYILEQDTPYEQWLHRNLFFAVSCLAEDLEVQDESILQQILQQLVNLEISDNKQVGEKTREQIFKSFCSFNETRFEAQALQMLKDSAQQINEGRFQKYRAALGEKEEATKTLLALLADEDSTIRQNAAEALGDLGNASPVMVNALLLRLTDEDSWVRQNAAQALGKLGNASKQVVDALLLQLADEDFRVRGYAAAALGYLDNASTQLVNALLLRLADEDSWVRLSAAYALSKLGNASAQVVDALLLRLADEDSEVRKFAVYALGNLGKNSSDVTTAVVEWISQHQDSEYIGSGIDALWRLAATDG